MNKVPNQFSSLGKLFDILKVFNSLARSGEPLNDDQTVGVALARAGIYKPRSKLPLEEALKELASKKPSQQGTQTAARDLRRFFMQAGLLKVDKKSTGSYALTNGAKDILASTFGPSRDFLWKQAMRGLVVVDSLTGRAVHPYTVMLRLIAERPGIEKRKLLLALEAHDDSDTEFQRIAKLSEKSYADLLLTMGVTESNAANQIKILPSIAQQLGDLIERQGQCYATLVVVVTEDGQSTAAAVGDPSQANLHPIAPENFASLPTFGIGLSSIVDLKKAIAQQRSRTIEHNKALQSLAKVLSAANYNLYEYPFDCLAVGKQNQSLLIEAKTLDGSDVDERQQVIRALAQLKYYRHFSLPPMLVGRPSLDIAAFTRKPSDKSINFLRTLQIIAVWLSGGSWYCVTPVGKITNFDPLALPFGLP